MSSKIKIIVTSAVVGMTVIPLAFAQGLTSTGPTNVGGFEALLQGLLNLLFTIFGIAAVFFILYAAFLYLTAAGDPEKVKKASKTLLYAVVAVVVAIIAWSLPLLINNVVSTYSH